MSILKQDAVYNHPKYENNIIQIQFCLTGCRVWLDVSYCWILYFFVLYFYRFFPVFRRIHGSIKV